MAASTLRANPGDEAKSADEDCASADGGYNSSQQYGATKGARNFEPYHRDQQTAGADYQFQGSDQSIHTARRARE